jgi:hypothetical protein
MQQHLLTDCTTARAYLEGVGGLMGADTAETFSLCTLQQHV